MAYEGYDEGPAEAGGCFGLVAFLIILSIFYGIVTSALGCEIDTDSDEYENQDWIY